MHRDSAVVGGAFGAAPLRLHARGLVALLGVVRLIEDANAVGVVVLAADDLLGSIPQHVMAPVVQRKELLEIPWRQISGQGHRLDTLAGQIGELATNVASVTRTPLAPGEAITEAAKKVV